MVSFPLAPEQSYLVVNQASSKARLENWNLSLPLENVMLTLVGLNPRSLG